MNIWKFNPHVGGTKIPELIKIDITKRINKHAAAKYKGLYSRIEIKFRGALCYIDAYKEPIQPDKNLLKITHESMETYMERARNHPIHLGRLRYFGNDNWSYAFYTYSNERYEPSTFRNGEWFGKPEKAFDIGALYLFD